MKAIIIIFSAIILSLEIVSAETKVFSGTLITDTDKIIEGSTFRFSYDETSNKVFVQTPATGLIVENGACKSSSAFRVCINRANFSYKNITTYKYYYEIDATIYKLTGSLSTNGSAIPSTLLQGESAEFTITIINPTDFAITNIVYKENFTPFVVGEVNGCTLDNNQITWQGALQSKYDKTCTATIVAEKEGTYKLVGSLSYFNSLETEKKATDTLAIKVLPKQLKIIQYIDKNIQAKQPFYMNVSLQNVHSEEDIDLSIKIEIPPNVNVLKTEPEFEIDSKTLKRSLVMEHGSFFNYSLHLEETSESEEPIRQSFYYTINGISDLIENATYLKQPKAKTVAKPSKSGNQPTINTTAAIKNSIQGSPGAKTENVSKTQQENKTAKQATIAEKLKLGFFSKKTLWVAASILIMFLIVYFAVSFFGRRKKGNIEVEDDFIKKLEESLRKE